MKKYGIYLICLGLVAIVFVACTPSGAGASIVSGGASTSNLQRAAIYSETYPSVVTFREEPSFATLAEVNAGVVGAVQLDPMDGAAMYEIKIIDLGAGFVLRAEPFKSIAFRDNDLIRTLVFSLATDTALIDGFTVEVGVRSKDNVNDDWTDSVAEIRWIAGSGVWNRFEIDLYYLLSEKVYDEFRFFRIKDFTLNGQPVSAGTVYLDEVYLYMR